MAENDEGYRCTHRLSVTNVFSGFPLMYLANDEDIRLLLLQKLYLCPSASSTRDECYPFAYLLSVTNETDLTNSHALFCVIYDFAKRDGFVRDHLRIVCDCNTSPSQAL